MKSFTKYFLAILVIGFGFLSYLLVEPFIVTIITAAILAYIFHPVYIRMKNKMGEKAAAFILTIAIVVIFLTLMIFVINSLTIEVTNTYDKVVTENKLFEILVLGEKIEEDNILTKTITFIEENPRTRTIFYQGLEKLTNFLISAGSNFLLSIPEKILQIFVAFFTLFFLFKDGGKIVDFIKKLLPLKKQQQEKVMKKIKEVTKGTIYGYILVAIVQGTIAGIGYFIFGVSSPMFWALMTMFASLIPYLGTTIIWAPLSVIITVSSLLGHETPLWKGIGLFLYGMLFVSTIDNLLRPKIVGDKAKISPLIVLLGALGGLKMMGFLGFIIGPLILTIFITMMQVYVEAKEK